MNTRLTGLMRSGMLLDDITALDARDIINRLADVRRDARFLEELSYYLKNIRWAAEECGIAGITMPGVPISEVVLTELRKRGFGVEFTDHNIRISW